MVPSTMDGPPITVPPLSKLQSTAPVLASRAYISPEFEPAYTTLFATLSAPRSILPGIGSAVCQRIFPVLGSRALHAPQVICCWDGANVDGSRSELAIAP